MEPLTLTSTAKLIPYLPSNPIQTPFWGNFSSPPDSCDSRPEINKRQCLQCLVSCHLKEHQYLTEM